MGTNTEAPARFIPQDSLDAFLRLRDAAMDFQGFIRFSGGRLPEPDSQFVTELLAATSAAEQAFPWKGIGRTAT
jgi:hypothetical protein